MQKARGGLSLRGKMVKDLVREGLTAGVKRAKANLDYAKTKGDPVKIHEAQSVWENAMYDRDKHIQESFRKPSENLEKTFRNLQKLSETFRNLRKPSETFGSVRFGVKVPVRFGSCALKFVSGSARLGFIPVRLAAGS